MKSSHKRWQLAVVLFAWLGAGASSVNGGVPGAVPAPQTLTIPPENSSAPSSEEWPSAQVVPATRAIGAMAERCKVRRVREWVSIRCVGTAASAVTLLGGTQKGVSFHLDPPGADRLPREAAIVFPIRQGERRVLSVWTLGPGYDGPLTVIPGIIVQAERTQGKPVLLLHDALNEPVPTARDEQKKAEHETP